MKIFWPLFELEIPVIQFVVRTYCLIPFYLAQNLSFRVFPLFFVVLLCDTVDGKFFFFC